MFSIQIDCWWNRSARPISSTCSAIFFNLLATRLSLLPTDSCRRLRYRWCLSLEYPIISHRVGVSVWQLWPRKSSSSFFFNYPLYFVPLAAIYLVLKFNTLSFQPIFCHDWWFRLLVFNWKDARPDWVLASRYPVGKISLGTNWWAVISRPAWETCSAASSSPSTTEWIRAPSNHVMRRCFPSLTRRNSDENLVARFCSYSFVCFSFHRTW